MTILAVSTLIVWGLALWSGAAALRPTGLTRRLKRLVAATLLAGLGSLLAALLVVLHAWHAFSGETLVARVTTTRLSPQDFTLKYLPVAEGASAARGAGPITQIRLQGDQWSLSGGLVKWHPWLTALGLKSYHKPMRVSGQFSRLEPQRTHPPTVYPLDSDVDWVWEWLYRVSPALPFIDAVYGSAAYVYVEPGVIQEVYVTPSGYLIKRRAKE